jgi:hypothetical protein
MISTLIIHGIAMHANFNNDRVFIKQIKEKWGHDMQFSHIILDYFFSPVKPPHASPYYKLLISR